MKKPRNGRRTTDDRPPPVRASGGRSSVVGGQGSLQGRSSAPPSAFRRIIWSIPLGWQLSTLYTLLLVVTLSVVGSLVYSQQENFLVHDAAQRLEQEAIRIVALTAPPSQSPHTDGGPDGQNGRGGSNPSQPDAGGHTSESAKFQLTENLVRGLSGQGITAAVLDPQGNIITSTQALEGETAPVVETVSAQRLADAVNSGQPIQWIATRSDGSRQVVVLMMVTQDPPTSTNTTSGIQQQPITLLVEQSASLAPTDAALAQLRTYLLLGVLGGTLAGVILVLLFTRGVLRSLDSVADTADAIATGDLQRRLELPEGRNEVARLGKAFDYMVGRLVTALEAQRRFVADASHELRTPLTSLKGLAEILVIGAHGNDTKVIEQAAQAINGELERMIRLVSDLLTLSRLGNTSGEKTPVVRRTKLDVCVTLGDAANQMAHLAEEHAVTLQRECAGPLWITGDVGQIKQVLLNLVDNALRYTPAGGEVSLKARAEEGSAIIEVKDTGSGIAERDLPHIFERFYRGDTSRTRATGNSGLGLAIVKEIVEAHGGTIQVESALQQGTTFTIHLPFITDHPAPDRTEASAVAATR